MRSMVNGAKASLARENPIRPAISPAFAGEDYG